MNKCLECGKETSNPKFCCDACMKQYWGRIYRKRSLDKYYESPVICKNCGKIIRIRENEPPGVTRKKIFCSRKCSVIYNNTKYPKRKRKKKYCKFCNKELIGKKRQNTFCNQSCHQKYKTKIYIEKWLAGKVSGAKGNGGYSISKRVRDYLLKKANYQCSRCGWSKVNSCTGNIPLEIDHIDGNWKNNRPENLRVLCPNCHSLTKTYRGANSGKGRGSKMRGSRLYQ